MRLAKESVRKEEGREGDIGGGKEVGAGEGGGRGVGVDDGGGGRGGEKQTHGDKVAKEPTIIMKRRTARKRDARGETDRRGKSKWT